MEYKDIKTADELESWYAEKEDILEGHVRDYAVPFGNVYHLDSPGYVSEERWCDTLPSDRERSTFIALQNGVSTKEIIEHKDEFGWIDRMAMSSVADDCAAEYFRYLSSDDMEKMLAALGKRVDVLATPTDDVFISVSPDAVLRQYPDITIDEAIQIRDNACENIWESGGQSDLDEIVWDQIGAEYKSIKSDSHRGLSDVKDAKAKQAVHVNDDRENDAVALDVQEK